MVHFEEKQYTIELYTGGNPAEDYRELMEELLFLLGTVGQDNMPSEGFYQVCNLLRNMVPDFETASKMTL